MRPTEHVVAANRPSGRWIVYALVAILAVALVLDLVFYTGFCADDDLQYFRAARQIMTWGRLSLPLRVGESRVTHVAAAALCAHARSAILSTVAPSPRTLCPG